MKPEAITQFFSQLENHSVAEYFGTITYNESSLDGLGMNPLDILSGKAQNSADGTKLIKGFRGTISGKITGYLTGRDFLSVLPSTASVSNIHGVITTDDGQRIAVKVLGETDINGQIIYQFQLRNYGETYHWLNDTFLFAKGSMDAATRQTTLKLYAFEQNPLDSPLIWEDPDISKVDFRDFPYTIEDFEKDGEGTIIYTGDGFLNGLETFGADLDKVFSGQFPIPEDGLRVNGYFSGPTAGNINGVIDGINYLRMLPDGSMRANSKIIINTFEGETLLLEALGAGFPPTSGPAWWESSRTVSNLEKYAAFNRLHNLGMGTTDFQSGKIHYTHYGFPTIKLKNQQ